MAGAEVLSVRDGGARVAVSAGTASAASLRVAARGAVPPSGGRRPALPGHFLETRYLKPLGISQQALAQAIGVSRRRVNEFVRGRRAITADTAVRLAHFFGNEPRFWMELQSAWDLHEAQRRFVAPAGERSPFLPD